MELLTWPAQPGGTLAKDRRPASAPEDDVEALADLATDRDSAGVYYMSIEDFERRATPSPPDEGCVSPDEKRQKSGQVHDDGEGSAPSDE